MMRLVLASLFIVALAHAQPEGGEAGVAKSDSRSKELQQRAKDNKDAADAAAAKEAKMAAVNKVISLLEDLQAQVIAEGEKEAAAYNKFACFCKETGDDKLKEIEDGTTSQTELDGDIKEQEGHRVRLDGEIAGHKKKIKDAEEEITRLEGERAKTLAVYELNEADLAGAIEGIAAAMKVLKASDVSFVQLQSVSKTVTKALMMADALGYSNSETANAIAFFQQPEYSVDKTDHDAVTHDTATAEYGERGKGTRGSGEQNDNVIPMQDYDFHSGRIIDMLEKLQKDFIAKKTEIDQAEVTSVATHNSDVQAQVKIVKAQNVLLSRAKDDRDKSIKKIAELNSEYSAVSAELLADKEYMLEMHEMCVGKRKAWDQRSQVRADEIQAIVSATTIIKSQVAEKTSKATVRLTQKSMQVFMAHQTANSQDSLAAIEAEAEAADAPSFLQIRPVSTKDDAKAVVLSMLRNTGDKLKSSLLISLAGKLSKDPFAKIKTLIQALIERLLAEAANEADQKGFCDKELGDAEQKRDLAAEAINKLDASMTEGEAKLFSLSEDIKTLATQIGSLTTALDAATREREAEKKENAATVFEAEQGEAAVKAAIKILKEFYAENKDNVVELMQGPADDAPDAGFANDEAYTGAQAEAGGILGMLDVILSDFQRTISETKKAEAQAVAEFYKFETETNMALKAKSTARDIKTTEYGELKNSLIDQDKDLTDEVESHNNAIEQIESLQPQCVATGMSYEDRVRLREEEMAALKKALCILTAYEQYGPDGLQDAC